MRRVLFIAGTCAALLANACGDSESDAPNGGGGEGGTGGSGATMTTGGGLPGCEPGDTLACYDGPDGTAQIGLCADGVRTCGEDGEYGTCEGQTLPAIEDDCAAIGDEDCDGISCSEATLGVAFTSNAYSQPDDVFIDEDGAVTMVGTYSDSVFFPDEGWLLPDEFTTGIFYGRVDADGGQLVAKSITAGTVPIAVSFDLREDGSGALGGGFVEFINMTQAFTNGGDEDAFLTRLAADGSYIWADTYGDASDQRITDVLIDSAGDVIVAGRFQGTIDFGGGASVTASASQDVFIAKIDGDTGVGVWAIAYGDPVEDDVDPSVAITSTDEIVLAGSFTGTLSIAGADALAATDEDIYVARLDAAGDAVWATSFAGTGAQTPKGIGLDEDDAVFIAGTMFGSVEIGATLTVPDATSDAFVAKLDVDGEPVDAKRFDDTGDTTVDAASIDAGGKLSFTGTMSESADFGGGPLSTGAPYLAKVDGDLAHLWSKALDSSFVPTAIHADPRGRGDIALAGFIFSDVDFGSGTVFSDPDGVYHAAFGVFQP